MSRGFGRRPAKGLQARARAQNLTAEHLKRQGPAAAFLDGKPVREAKPRKQSQDSGRAGGDGHGQ